MQLPSSPHFVRYDSTDSTNERALEAIAAGTAKHGEIHLTDFQTDGRGRLGRTWVAKPGESLLFSLILLPGETAPPQPHVTIATCMAVFDVLRELGLPATRLKWPNDVLIEDAKICGILLETRGLEGANPHFVVGVGLNLQQEEFPAEILAERPVTSLRLQDLRVARHELLDSIWNRLRTRLDQDARGLFEEYRHALALPNSVQLETASERLEGSLVAIEPDRGVVLETPDGQRKSVALEFVRALSAND